MTKTKEFKQAKKHIRTFMRNVYTDTNLVQLLELGRSGKLSYNSCDCFIGIVTCDHLEHGFYSATEYGGGVAVGRGIHLTAARQLPGAITAEAAFAKLAMQAGRCECPACTCGLGNADARRRRIIIPMALAEIRRRQRSIPEINVEEELVTA